MAGGELPPTGKERRRKIFWSSEYGDGKVSKNRFADWTLKSCMNVTLYQQRSFELAFEQRAKERGGRFKNYVWYKPAVLRIPQCEASSSEHPFDAII